MIEIKNLQVKYDDFIAIDNISLNVEEGEFFTLLGPSGCGKTTALRAIAGFLNPSEGEININGKNIIPIPVEKRELGMIFQSYALFPTMTVYDNIAYGLKIDKQSKAQIGQRVKELSKLVELNENQLVKNVSDLSGGQQQRVAIARALAKKPKIVLLDEPLSNLDSKLRIQTRSEIMSLYRRLKTTTVYVTHDQVEAMTMATKIVVLKKGEIQQIGSPSEIYSKPKNKFVAEFIGSPQMNFIKCKLNKEFVYLGIRPEDCFLSDDNNVYYSEKYKFFMQGVNT